MSVSSVSRGHRRGVHHCRQAGSSLGAPLVDGCRDDWPSTSASSALEPPSSYEGGVTVPRGFARADVRCHTPVVNCRYGTKRLAGKEPMHDTSPRPRLYFAYGSNLDPEQMQQRCPGAEAAGVARLDGWQFRIGQRGVATIVESSGTQVWGGLWAVTDEHVAALDRAEGVHVGLYRRETLAVDRGDETVDAVVYIEDFTGDGEARPGYLERIVRGAAWFELPPDYRSGLAEVAV